MPGITSPQKTRRKGVSLAQASAESIVQLSVVGGFDPRRNVSRGPPPDSPLFLLFFHSSGIYGGGG